MANKKQINLNVQGIEVGYSRIDNDDFISITDIARLKNAEAPADIIKNWMRSKNTIELLGLWEKLNNPDCKLVEFDQFKNDAGYIRDYSNVSQLVCLANLENLNAVWIEEGLPQPARLQRLNQVAIQQMQLLTQDVSTHKLKGGNDE